MKLCIYGYYTASGTILTTTVTLVYRVWQISGYVRIDGGEGERKSPRMMLDHAAVYRNDLAADITGLR